MEYVSAKDSLIDLDADHENCVLAWMLTRRARASIQQHELEALHAEVQQCAELVGARLLEVNTMSGLLKCDSYAGRVTPADTALRCGQLLCRWATQQVPEIGIRVGMAAGPSNTFELPCRFENGASAVLGHTGPAVVGAMLMAETAPRGSCVHFSHATKEKLRVFERLPFSIGAGSENIVRTATTTLSGLVGATVSEGGRAATAASGAASGEAVISYCLEPWVEACDVDGELEDALTSKPDEERIREAARDLMLTSMEMDLLVPGKAHARLKKMSEEDFGLFLANYGVNLAEFGKGYAKTVGDFYKELVHEKKSSLMTHRGQLQRRLELVRVSLVAKGPDGTDRSLKLTMEIMEDGRARARHQKMACVVSEGCTWKQAVTNFLRERFRLPEQFQQENLTVEGSWIKEEKFYSPSYPGIKTIYLAHEVRMRISNPRDAELAKIGLPTMRNFTSTPEEHSNRTWHWTWSADSEEISNSDTLAQLLQEHRISHMDFEPEAFQDLVTEVYDSKTSVFVVRNGELLRFLDIVKVWVQAEILSVPHCLVTKTKVKYGKRSAPKDRPISMRMLSDQTWQQAVVQAVARNLGVDAVVQQACMLLDESSFVKSEEIEYSRSYPGLKSVYRIHEVIVRVLPGAKIPNAHTMGLPEGTTFSFCRQEANPETGAKKTVVSTYKWVPIGDNGRPQPDTTFRRSLVDERMKAAAHLSTTSFISQSLRRVMAPQPMKPPPASEWKSAYLAQELMRDKKTDWARARNAARRIRDKDYDCGQFFEDCTCAFPELNLYIVDDADMVSGRSADEEFQRTVGALFSFYWLMRLDMGGAEGFSFGVGDNFISYTEQENDEGCNRSEAEVLKRRKFFKDADWKVFEQLMECAGLRTKDSTGIDEDRVLAMLVLTSIHDIMKVSVLRPTVQRKDLKDAPEFCGYKSGDEIADHDLALGYLLTHVPDALPSYSALPTRSRESVRFTQGQLQYNMGWLVQAEAPPGMLFREFKRIVQSGAADPCDVSFYFVHWLTDLAGADGNPLEGSEKFVLKFPQRVLASFLSSFQFVKDLQSQTEVKVFEDYLKWRWRQIEPQLGPEPEGSGAVAKMRLVVMAQSDAEHVLEAHGKLGEADRDVLDLELARTGCEDQSFASDPVPPAGPAFLVYYAPALMQRNCAANPAGAMVVLAEVLRRARELWPLRTAGKGAGDDDPSQVTVIVRIDAIKDIDLEAIATLPAGTVWALQKTSHKDCQVKKLNLQETAQDGSSVDLSAIRILQFQVPALGSLTIPAPSKDEWGRPRPADRKGPCGRLADIDEESGASRSGSTRRTGGSGSRGIGNGKKQQACCVVA